MNFEIIGRPTYGSPALIVVPKLEKQAIWASMIKPGSSMVAYIVESNPSRPKDLICYYEGNVYGACNLMTFQDRALCAYGRMATKYPTTAVCGDTIQSLEIVGLISPTIFEMLSTPASEAWISQYQNNI